jgi:SecD/SecF fusion protein
MPWYLNLPLVIALLVVPFLVGTWLARWLRMPDYGWKIGLCLWVVAISVGLLLTGGKPRLGVDLSGGVILVYEVDQQKKIESGNPTVDMDEMVAAVSRRVNPGGQKEVTIRKVGVEGVEIIIPKATEEDIRQVEQTIGKAGSLEFRILANRRDHEAIVERAMEEKSNAVKDEKGVIRARWVPVDKSQEQDFAGRRDIVIRQKQVGGRAELQVLVMLDDQNVTGAYLRNASAGRDEQGGHEVEFTFNATGGALFGQLTSENLPDPTQPDFKRQLGIMLDGNLFSAPNIQSAIYDRGRITGRFSEMEVKALVNVLNAGKLPAALTSQPISRMFSGPTLGGDTIRKSTYAMAISSILVPLFMLWYYRFAGFVACIALVINMTMLVAIMIAIKAAFTLPGFAGLALTIGMAVDNNVLVYERLREELERGATLRMAIRNAFQRAAAVIIDANLTTILAATVLYVIGTDQVRGFAVPLWLGVAISMFTSVFVARVIFDVFEKQRWISRVKMLRVIGVTNIDFMSWFPVTAMASLLITIGGFGVAVYRGVGLFDIDFTGGVSVQTLFKQPQETGQIRQRLTALPDLAVSSVTLLGEEQGKRFVINTSRQDLDGVQKYLKEVYGDQLASNTMTAGQVSRIEAGAATPAVGPELGPSASAKEKPAPQSTIKAQPGAKSEPLPKKSAKPDASPQKPAGKPASTPEKPSGKQSRADLPAMNLLASADPSQVLLALAEKSPATKPAEKPAADKVTTKPAEKPADKAASKPAEKPAAKPAGTAAAKPAEKPAESPAEGTAEVSFVGGTKARLQFGDPVAHDTVQNLLRQGMESQGIQSDNIATEILNEDYRPGQSSSFSAWDVKIQLPPEKAEKVFAKAQQLITSEPFFPASSKIGGTVAGGARVRAFYALVVSWLCMIVYLWVRFQKVAFGVAAVVALVHDVFVMIGAIAISYYVAGLLGFLGIQQFKIGLPEVVAMLTIIGFSVNDTIVIFDRIREIRGKDPMLTKKMVNDATNQTMSRTLLTSFTVLLVTVILYAFGGQAIHGMMFALLVGVFTGTYSSIYVAAPILLWLIHPRQKRVGQN